MSKLDEHPTIIKARESTLREAARPLDSQQLIERCLELGADDAGIISIDRSEIAEQREDILRAAPWTKSLLSFVCKMNREPIRSPARSIANLEFHHTGDDVNEVARRLVTELEARGHRALNPSMGFPMEMDRFPGKIWVVAHKPVAVAAGLGQMGIHRNVIHPKFGNFILLGTILLDHPIDATEQSRPIDFNPCLECKLCVAACPVGAIKPDGEFDFSACYTHNYREFMGGFTDWVETVASSRSRNDYRSEVNDAESASMWASLSFGANYKAAYCLSVCPAGEDVISPWLADKRAFKDETLKPLTEKPEPVYVVSGSDAEEHVGRRFPSKTARPVRGSLHPGSIDGFLRYMHLQFQRGKSKGLDAIYHFTFTGAEQRIATVTIRDQTLSVEEGHHGNANLRVTADSKTWIGFLARERNLAWALITRRIRLKGSPIWLIKFGRCFPS
ncbi:MAG: SCP2 sterol-binding domain-containing protein [Planctomycetota bacterium]